MIKDNSPVDWKLIRLMDYGTTYSGLTGKDKNDFGSGKPYIPYLNIYSNPIVKEGDFDYVKISDDETQALVQYGDLFFTTSSETPDEVGMCSVYIGKTVELYLNSFCFGFRPTKKNVISTEYLAHFFRSKYGRKLIYKLAQGATRYNISKSSLLNLSFPIPNYSEQEEIAHCLSRWDMAINIAKAILEKKILQKKWIMQILLTGKKRLSGFSGRWDETNIRGLFDPIEAENDGNEHPIMTISSKYGFLSQQDKFEKIIAGNSLEKYTLLRKGDFAYNKGNSDLYEMGCIYQLNDSESAIVPFVYICFRPKNLICSSFYRYWFLFHGLDRQLKRIITSGARGDGLLNVNKKDFFNLRIPVPPKDEQEAIARVLNTAELEISLLKSKLEKLKDQKRGLMQILLTDKKD